MFKKVILASLLSAIALVGASQAQSYSPSKTASTRSDIKTQDTPAKKPPTEAMAWVLGTKLAHAAIGRDAGASPQKVNELFDTSVEIAQSLGTTVSPLPKRTTEAKTAFSAKILHYMLVETEPIARHLVKTYNKRHSDLFEMATKSTALAIVYSPGDETSLTVAEVIENRSKRCELPERLWKPLVDSVRKNESYDIVVKEKLGEMQNGIRRLLIE
jgi:hypothetical protein